MRDGTGRDGTRRSDGARGGGTGSEPRGAFAARSPLGAPSERGGLRGQRGFVGRSAAQSRIVRPRSAAPLCAAIVPRRRAAPWHKGALYPGVGCRTMGPGGVFYYCSFVCSFEKRLSAARPQNSGPGHSRAPHPRPERDAAVRERQSRVGLAAPLLEGQWEPQPHRGRRTGTGSVAPSPSERSPFAARWERRRFRVPRTAAAPGQAVLRARRGTAPHLPAAGGSKGWRGYF